jgi:plastocyanin
MAADDESTHAPPGVDPYHPSPRARDEKKGGSMRSTTGRAGVMVVVASLVAMLLGACSDGGGGGTTRQVLVDYSSDEYGSFALFNFPEKVTVRQGDTVEFKQTWTGEPHTVTGGTVVSEKIAGAQTWIDFFDSFEALLPTGAVPNPEDPGDATAGDLAKGLAAASDTKSRDAFTKAYDDLRTSGVPLPALDPTSTQPFSELVTIVEEESDKIFSDMPSAFDDDDNLAQNVGQPCFLTKGLPPEDTKKPCSKAEQRQPEFTGRQSFYNSGVIPYEGKNGNTFEVKISDDAKPGSYSFLCAVHGFLQKTEVEIVAADATIPSQAEVNRQIRSGTKAVTDVLDKIQRSAEQEGKITPPGSDEAIEGPFAGLPGEDHTAIDEFVPKKMTVKAGEPITWKMMGSDHTISFNVPRYFPIMEFLKDGTVRINPKLQPAAGGAVPYEPPEDETDAVPKHDGGTFDGTGFWSSGLIGGEPYLEYTMTISKPGTYAYACLLHPPMVGSIKVTA